VLVAKASVAGKPVVTKAIGKVGVPPGGAKAGGGITKTIVKQTIAKRPIVKAGAVVGVKAVDADTPATDTPDLVEATESVDATEQSTPQAAAADAGRSAVKAAPSGDPAAPRTDTWRDFEGSDPLYALLGEVGQDKVYVNGLRAEVLDRYLHKLFIDKAARKPKDWVEVWAAMDIPVDNQPAVLTPILAFGLKHSPETLGRVIFELLKGHRVKTNAIVDSVQATMSGYVDKYGVLREFLFNIFPKGPASEWGWSRIGWSWTEWWKIVEGTLCVLDPLSAFDELAALLDRVEATGKTPLVDQSMIWKAERLAKARKKLCLLGSVEDEVDLIACVDAALA